MHPRFEVERLGEDVAIFRCGERPSRELTALLVAAAVMARYMEGVVEAVAGQQTLFCEFEPSLGSGLISRVRDLLDEAEPMEGTAHEISIEYNGADLDWACEHLGLDPARFIQIHSGQTYDVRMIGSPGFVYLSEVAEEIHLPRLDEPRLVVPELSVGIGGSQTGIYGLPRPGGWRLIGTIASLPKLQPGDSVRFAVGSG